MARMDRSTHPGDPPQPQGQGSSNASVDQSGNNAIERMRLVEDDESEKRRTRIAEAAYRRAEERGFASGSDLDDWLAAEREVDAASSTQDTPGRPQASSSRQQTQPDQGIQSGSSELDAKDAGSQQVERKYPDRRTDDGKYGGEAKQPNPRIAK